MATFEQLQALQVKSTDAYLRGLQSVLPPIGNMIATNIPLSTEITVSPIGRSIGPWREWTGARQAVGAVGTSHILYSKPYEKTVAVNRIKLETDQTGVEMLQFEELGKLAARWMDQLVFDKLALGETDLCYDGKAFFADDHPGEDGTAFDNLLGSGGPAWYVFDMSGMTKPFIFGTLRAPELVHQWSPTDQNVFWSNEYVSGLYAHGVAEFGLPQSAVKLKSTLDSSNFETAHELIMGHKDNKGQSLGLGQDVLVVVPTSLAADAKRLFGRSDLGSNGENIHNGIRFVVSQRLSNAT